METSKTFLSWLLLVGPQVPSGMQSLAFANRQLARKVWEALDYRR
jgi:hypothetical protein